MNARLETIMELSEQKKPIPLEIGVNLIGGMIQLAMTADKKMAEILTQNTRKPSIRRQEEFAALDKIMQMFNACYDEGRRQILESKAEKAKAEKAKAEKAKAEKTIEEPGDEG